MNRLKIQGGELYIQNELAKYFHCTDVCGDYIIRHNTYYLENTRLLSIDNEGEIHCRVDYLTKQEKLTLLEYLKSKVENQ